MYALSIQQPWADLILYGYKDVENRVWRAPLALLGSRFAVHASKTFDTTVLFPRNSLLPSDFSWSEHQELYERAQLPQRRGALLGTVVLDRSVWLDDIPISEHSEWAQGPWCFVLKDPILYPEPVPYRGQLKFFTV